MTDYHSDFFAWTQETSALIKQRQFDRLDLAALADEVESLGNRDKREVSRRMSIILMHLLKQHYQPNKLSRSWQLTIDTQQAELDELFESSPSLRGTVRASFTRAYRIARMKAATETGLALSTFPAESPFSIDEVLPSSDGGEK